MSQERIVSAVTEILLARGVTFAPELKIVQDLGWDSQELVTFLFECEDVIGRDIDGETIAIAVEGDLRQLCLQLARISTRDCGSLAICD